MDRTIFGRKTLNTQRNRVDRFVAPRSSFDEARRRRSWHASCDANAANNDYLFGKHLKQKKYKSYLDDVLDLEPQDTNNIHKHWIRPWPCKPRKKSYLSSADSILDLPTYSYATFKVTELSPIIINTKTVPELLDWSNDNILVAALGTNYHKWSWRTQSLISQGFTRFEIQCCKFDPLGKLLVLGTDVSTVEVHKSAISKKIAHDFCPCIENAKSFCSITAVDWSPTGNSFATGCSYGAVVAYTCEVKLFSWKHPMRSAILLVKVSPDSRFVAVTTVKASEVLLLTWPSLDTYSSLESKWTIRTIAWHPWRSALLGVGAVTPTLQTRIALWNAPTSEMYEMTLGPKRYSIDAMLFSKITGELVLSVWNADRAIINPKTCSQLVVMSDMETVVDQWGEGRSGLDRVRTMVFSPDGTKLATATSDEDLIIWNFLPEDNRKNKAKCKRFSAIPVYLDEAMQGYSIR